MTGSAPLRILLHAAPEHLVGLDGEAERDGARARLLRLRGDADLASIVVRPPGSVLITLLVESVPRDEDISQIAAALREYLGLGPGPHELLPDELEEARGIPPQGRTCRQCYGPDGTHLPGCPADPATQHD